MRFVQDSDRAALAFAPHGRTVEGPASLEATRLLAEAINGLGN